MSKRSTLDRFFNLPAQLLKLLNSRDWFIELESFALTGSQIEMVDWIDEPVFICGE